MGNIFFEKDNFLNTSVKWQLCIAAAQNKATGTLAAKKQSMLTCKSIKNSLPMNVQKRPCKGMLNSKKYSISPNITKKHHFLLENKSSVKAFFIELSSNYYFASFRMVIKAGSSIFLKTSYESKR